MTWLERLMFRLGFRFAFGFADDAGAAGGGSGGDGGGGDDDDDDDDDAGGDGGAGDDNDPDDVDGLKKALEAERALRAKAEKDSKKNARAIRDLNKEIEKIKASAGTEEEKKIASEREAAAKETAERLAKPIKRNAIRAAAAGRMNPAAAVRLVSLDDIEVDEDGEVDEASVKDAIDALLEEMPELKIKAGTKTGDTKNGKPEGKGSPDMNDLLKAAVTGRK